MATADTARLIAALELQDKFSRPLGNADRALGGFERRMGSATRATQGLSVAGVAVGTALGALGARLISGGIRGIVGTVAAGVESLYELENVTVATNTVLASTQGVAGQTAAGIRDLAEEYENLNATIDDKVIQSGANLLLTFTNIREDAFEPALAAALDMNEAMGGGPEGLQSTIIQIGKALNDPIRGATALRRVGVSLSQQQQDQIKILVEQNDLYGAQQIVLDELSTEFGGRFAAAGDTATGSQARLRDKIEDVQKALAGPLIPAIDRARTKLTELLASPAVLEGAEKLGDALAGLFTEERLEAGVGLVERGIAAITNGDFSGITGKFSGVVASVGALPWQQIGDAARLLGTGSKALLDAFLGLPGWVQTAVLTGWGLNKLTGGALGGIVGELGKGLIKGVLGMNAGVVNINAATVNGGVGGAGGGRGGLLANTVGTLGGAAVAAGGVLSIQDITSGTEEGVRRGILSQGVGGLIGRAIGPQLQEIFDSTFKSEPLDVRVDRMNELLSDRPVVSEVRKSAAEARSFDFKLLQTARTHSAITATLPDTAVFLNGVGQITASTKSLKSIMDGVNSKAAQTRDLQAQHLAAARGGNSTLAAIRDKKQNIVVNLKADTTVFVSATQVAQSITTTQRSIGGGTYDNSGGI